METNVPYNENHPFIKWLQHYFNGTGWISYVVIVLFFLYTESSEKK